MTEQTPMAVKVLKELQDITLGIAESYVNALDTARKIIISNSDMLELENDFALNVAKYLTLIQEDIIKLSNVSTRIITTKNNTESS